MNEDKFKLWRLALSAIHADGKVTKEEEEWFKKKVKQLDDNKILKFSDAQIAELEKVIHEPVENFMDEFKKLDKPADASQVLHFVRIISHLDKDFSDKEKELYKKLEAACLENVDVKSVTQTVTDMENESYHEDKVYSIDNPSSRFESFFMHLMRYLNPGDYKEP